MTKNKLRNKISYRAMQYAYEKMDGLLDDAGDPAFLHPSWVAHILKQVARNDDNLIAAAYLHDLLEDTDVAYEDLVEEFNLDVANLVLEVTKMKVHGVKYFPHLKTKRGYVLKFADRLHNLSRIKVQKDGKWTEDKIARYMAESVFWKNKPKIAPTTNENFRDVG